MLRFDHQHTAVGGTGKIGKCLILIFFLQAGFNRQVMI